MPLENTEFESFQVTFLIPAQRAHYGIHGGGFQIFGNVSRFHATATFHTGRQRLQCGLSCPDEWTGWIQLLGFQCINDRLVGRNLIVTFWQSHQHTFRGITGDVRQ